MNYTQLFNSALKKRVLKHILFWIVNIATITIPLFVYMGDEAIIHLLPRILIIYIYIIISVYINLYFLVPFFLNNRKYLIFTVLQMVNIGLFSFLKVFTKLVLFNDEIDENVFEETTTAIAAIVGYLVFTTSVKYVLQFLKERISYHQVLAELSEVEKEKLEVELNALKAQLNPHFMFNTLNNIYSLSLDKSDKAPELILMLSDLISYTLYDCKEKFVSVAKEIEFIENYLELERVRVKGNVKINFNVSGHIENKEISPLLLLVYIENAFKHGISTRPIDPFINIDLIIDDTDVLNLKVENSKEETNTFNSEKNGIGLRNAEKRLNLLYPERHKLSISDNKSTYIVQLEIDLNQK